MTHTDYACYHRLQILQDMVYGFLTYLNGTFFIKRVEQDTYAFTDAFTPSASRLTVLEMLLCEWACGSG